MTLIYAANDDYGKLVALLDERRRMVKRHEREQRLPSRKQYALADKLAVMRRQKDELAGLNRRIEELTEATGGSV